MDDAPALNAQALGKDFANTPALRSIDLTLGSGQVCAILGPNGAGKTTLIHCALGLTRPTRGRIALFGHAAGSLAARRLTGVVLQEAQLPDLLTGREQLALQASYFDAPRELSALIDETQLGAFADKRYKVLSGGQKRRLQFAVALVGQPRLLFLDEPTTGLDGDARRAVWDGVRALAAAGTSVVLTTHYLEEADALADRVVVLEGGRVIADDEASAIRARVSGAVIQCATALTQHEVAALPAVRNVRAHGRLFDILSDDAPTTLTALLARDGAPTELTVRKPSLEEAFARLTQPDAGVRP